jgi:hypothetical protein
MKNNRIGVNHKETVVMSFMPRSIEIGDLNEDWRGEEG